jgi:CRP-like cAMP-binding protein
MSPGALSVVEPHTRHHDFEEGSVLWDAGLEVDRIYFPASGIISIVLPLKDGGAIEVASIGREGCAGIDHAFAPTPSATRGITQVAGTFVEISASQLLSAMRQNNEISTMAALGHDWILMQSQQLAACNAVHPADARFCRWLLQSCERVENDLVPSTQEAIARLLGIRRTTVTAIAHQLQNAGIISYRRGKIVVRDQDRLRSAACSCHAALDRRHWPSERLAATRKEPATPPAAPKASVV